MEHHYYSEDEVVRSLWQAYKKTQEYQSGMDKAISSIHPLIREQEELGLTRIFNKFITAFSGRQLVKYILSERTIGDWLNEWKEMNNILLSNVLKSCGDWRQIEVRFGDPGDEDLYKIPKPKFVAKEVSELASFICENLPRVKDDIDSQCNFLARVHYQFIRIHPFADGNGRMGRALTDQLALSMGLPPIITGFPRSDAEKKRIYHAAIKDCIYDHTHAKLTLWIKSQIILKIEEIA